MIERIATGVSGLDDLIEGGFPKGSITLVSGGPGAGKTILSSQFLWEGLQNGETCLYITTEELSEEILAEVREFGWDFEDYEQDNRFVIKQPDTSQWTQHLRKEVVKLVEEVNPDRIVIDSVSVFGTYWDDEKEIRQNINKLVKELRELDTTTVLTAELPDETAGTFSRYGVTEFVVDGIVKLSYISIGTEAFGNLEVRKMRKTAVEKGQYKMFIDENGISLGEETLDMK